MNFDKENFSKILSKIRDSYGSINQMAEKTDVTAAYISKLIRLMYDNAPSPEILNKISNASKGITTYEELMKICGYSEDPLENIVYNIYLNQKEYADNIHKKDKKSHYEVGDSIETFQEYLNDLISTIEHNDAKNIYLEDYYNKEFFIEDYSYVAGFLCLYDSFLKNLETNNYITILNYNFVNWFSIDDIYANFNGLESLELLSYNCFNIEIKEQNLKNFIKYIKEFSKCLNLSFLSDFDNNALTEIFKKKINSNKENSKKLIAHQEELINQSKQFYPCPVYGKISAGQPNWAEECLEGYLPIDPNLMNIVNPEEYFFLRVDGESMNKVIKNGAYALIHKQDIVDDGEIAVVLVNGDSATLKIFAKQNDVVVLTPNSTDDTFKQQIYTKETPIKILGKYVGKMEMND